MAFKNKNRSLRLIFKISQAVALLIPLSFSSLFSPEILAQRAIRPQQSPNMAGTQTDVDGAEFSFARLVYSGGGYGFSNWGSRARWTTDMPEAEHFFMEGLMRLTRLDGRRVNLYNGEGSQIINLRDETVYDYPFLYAVEVGYWTLETDEIAILREYLLRGGFLIVDDFHGSAEWSGFVATMQRIFPSRPIIDIPEDDEVFHVLYDLDSKVQIPGLASLYNGQTWEKDGYEAHWRGVYDDEGRLIVAINHNMDLGDAWEHADTPGYPEPMTALSYRFAVNYVIYAMTH